MDVRPFEAICRKLFRTPTHASTHLYGIVRGHAWDLRFQSVHTVCSILFRLVSRHHTQLLDWQNEKSGWPGALRQGLHDLGWTESSSWTWSHPGLQTTLSFIEQDAGWKDHVREVRHLLRESWRHTFFHKWLAMDRVDSRECAGTIYSAPRVKILRLLHLSSHEVAVVTGAQVSPARFEKMIPGSRFSCPWCGGEGERATWRHCAWDCTFAPRPPDVSFASCFDVMQHRLGWPSGQPSEPEGSRVLQSPWGPALTKKSSVPLGSLIAAPSERRNAIRLLSV